jgi:membrane associated rhomboid family serine protease/Flp pilus assembly protein TadD
MANCIRCGRQLPALTFGKKICQWCVQHEAAQRGEEGDDGKQPVMAVPWVRRESSITVTHMLFGANVAVFVAMVAATVMAGGAPGAAFSFPISVHFGANYGPLTLSGNWWRLLTYMFLHGDIWHIAFNMWCLWSLGGLCESLYGRWTYAAIYLITGVSGGLASVAWNPRVWSVGASGAIFGLAGALISSFYLGEFDIPRDAIQANLKSLLFFAGFNILFGISAIGDLFGIRVDNSAHIGGLFSGLILGASIALVAPEHDTPLRRVSILGVVALAVAGAAVGVQHWRGGPMSVARALASISENDPNRRITELQAIVKQQPNLVQAHFSLGDAYFDRGQYPEAEGEFKKVLELQPENAGARFNLGITLLNEKRREDANAAFTQMVSQDAKSAEGHYGLGLVLFDEEKYQAAIEEYKTAAGLKPHLSGVYSEIGHCYAKLKMYDAAIAAYIQEKEKNGDEPDVETGLADAYQAKGMTQQAQEARNKAIQLKGQNTD